MSKFHVMLDQTPSVWITPNKTIVANDTEKDVVLSTKPTTIARTIRWGLLAAHMQMCKAPFWPFRNLTVIKAHRGLLSWDLNVPFTIPSSGGAIILGTTPFGSYTSTILEQYGSSISDGRPVVVGFDSDFGFATVRSITRTNGRNPRLMLEIGDVFDLRQVYSGEVQILS